MPILLHTEALFVCRLFLRRLPVSQKRGFVSHHAEIYKDTTMSKKPKEKENRDRICRMVTQLKTLQFLTLFCFPSAFPTWTLQEAKPCWSTDSNTSLPK